MFTKVIVHLHIIWYLQYFRKYCLKLTSTLCCEVGDGKLEWWDVDLEALFHLIWCQDEIKDVKEGILKKFLYGLDLVLVGDSWSEVEERYGKWKD